MGVWRHYKFHSGSIHGKALMRVQGANPQEIYGLLTSRGQISSLKRNIEETEQANDFECKFEANLFYINTSN